MLVPLQVSPCQTKVITVHQGNRGPALKRHPGVIGRQSITTQLHLRIGDLNHRHIKGWSLVVTVGCSRIYKRLYLMEGR